jgi:hypothetical protein
MEQLDLTRKIGYMKGVRILVYSVVGSSVIKGTKMEGLGDSLFRSEFSFAKTNLKLNFLGVRNSNVDYQGVCS